MRDRKEALTTLLGMVSVVVVLAVVVGDRVLPGSDVPRLNLLAPGFLAFSVNVFALMNLPLMIASDREEGTLLRMRALPRGPSVYLWARLVTVVLYLAVQVVVFLLIVRAATNIVLPRGPMAWATLGWVLMLGVMATVPLGIAVGCLVPPDSRNAAGIVLLPVMGLMSISGMLLPIDVLWTPVQVAAQAFPPYWQGLGLRSVFLPDGMRVAEIGGGWRLPQAAGVLGCWALAGLLLAPWALRTAARKESGSRLARGLDRSRQAS